MRIPLIIFTVAFFCDARQNDFFDEELFLKQLQSGHVYSLFQFSTTWDVNIFEQTIRMFVTDFHFTFYILLY